MENEILHLVLTGFGMVSALMVLFWVIQLFTKNAGILDLGWALGLVILTGHYAVTLDGYALRQVIIFVLVSFWGLRLSKHILERLLHKEEDRRYQLLRNDWAPFLQLKFLALFIFEALLDVILSIPFLVICLNETPQLHIFEYLGLLVWVTGFVGESIADKQLNDFKKDPQNRGKICQQGLWNYSRHPNYFFEWLMWVAYFIFALGSPYGWLAIVSPAIMYVLLTKVTGIPMIEEHALKTKGQAFKDYMRTTSIFFPMPKKP